MSLGLRDDFQSGGEACYMIILGRLPSTTGMNMIRPPRTSFFGQVFHDATGRGLDPAFHYFSVKLFMISERVGGGR